LKSICRKTADRINILKTRAVSTDYRPSIGIVSTTVSTSALSSAARLKRYQHGGSMESGSSKMQTSVLFDEKADLDPFFCIQVLINRKLMTNAMLLDT